MSSPTEDGQRPEEAAASPRADLPLWRKVLVGVRSEDLLVVGFALTLVVLLGATATLRKLRLTEEDYWSYSFIVAPMALLVFMASLKYALGLGGSAQRMLGTAGTILRDWSPFVFLLLFYEAFRTKIWWVLRPVDLDEVLLAWDRRLFGETPSVWMQEITVPWLTDVLTVAYFLHLVLPALLGLGLYRRQPAVFRQFLLAVLLCFMVGSVGYMLVPAIGPNLAFPELYHVALSGQVHAPLSGILDIARVPRDVFPSLHVGIATIVLWYARRAGRAWFLVFLPLVLGNWFSTIYLRYHYLIDCFAGWAAAGLAMSLSAGMRRLELAAHERLRRVA